MTEGIEFEQLSKIKFVFFLSGRAMSDKELYESLYKLSNKLIFEHDIHKLVDKAIEKDLIEKNSGLYYLNSHSFPILDNVYSFLNEKLTPVHLNEIAAITTRNSMKIKRKLEDDYRFINIENTEFWLLTEWQISNDEVYEYFDMSGFDELTISDIQELFLTTNTSITKVFIPEFDRRFYVNQNIIRIRDESNDFSQQNNFSYLQSYKNEIINYSKEIINKQVILKDINSEVQNELYNMISISPNTSLSNIEINKRTELFETLIKKQSVIHKVINDLKDLQALVGEFDEQNS